MEKAGSTTKGCFDEQVYVFFLLYITIGGVYINTYYHQTETVSETDGVGWGGIIIMYVYESFYISVLRNLI